MYDLMVACTAFLLLHLGVAGTRMRRDIVRVTGEKVYLAGFALCALACMIAICRSYGPAWSGPANRTLYVMPQWYHALGLPVMLVAFLFGLPGVLMKNPTSAGQEEAAVQGMQRITRHPFLWGAALWSLYHLIGAGDCASIVLFLTFFILAVGGTFSIDVKCRRRLGAEGWQALAATTSNIPFAAIFSGRAHFRLWTFYREYGLWRLLVCLIIFTGILYLHQSLFGEAPLPVPWMVRM